MTLVLGLWTAATHGAAHRVMIQVLRWIPSMLEFRSLSFDCLASAALRLHADTLRIDHDHWQLHTSTDGCGTCVPDWLHMATLVGRVLSSFQDPQAGTSHLHTSSCRHKDVSFLEAAWVVWPVVLVDIRHQGRHLNR